MHVRSSCTWIMARGGVALVVAGCVIAGQSGLASARPSAKSHGVGAITKTAPSPVGSFSYYDSLGDTDEGLTVNEDGTLLFASGCSGLWVQSGTAVTMDVNADCFGQTWIFTGTVGTKGLSSAKKPGATVVDGTGTVAGTWYAVRNGPIASSNGALAGHDVVTNGISATGSATGSYTFSDSNGDSDDPMTLNSDGTLDFTPTGFDCTGLWVQLKKTIAWDLSGAGGCNESVFAGTVGAKGLSSIKKPGAANFNGSAGAWYATKG